MKIFVLGPETNDCFTHNVAHAFRMLGHEVRSMPPFLFGATHSRALRLADLMMTKASSYWRLRRDRWALTTASEFKPAITFVCTRTLEPETVESIRKLTGGIVLCWYGDPPGNLLRDHITSGEYDAVFMKDLEFVEKAKNIIGIEAYHLDEACNPAWHRPSTNIRQSHLVVAGTLYGYRNSILRRLTENNIEISAYGPYPSPWVSQKIISLHTRTYLDHKNKAEVFEKALACLNTFVPAERDSLNCRIFETCGSGGLLLTEHKKAITRCFEPEKEYLSFASFEECLNHIVRIQEDSSFAENIRRNAVKRAHGEHTYEHRIREIFKILSI